MAEDPLPPAKSSEQHAFGWPPGSVRALLAMLVFASIWAYLILRPERRVPEYLNDLLFIILGHYFAVRGRDEVAEAPGAPAPLNLPRGSVRFILVAGFIASAIVLQRQGRLRLGAIRSNPAVVTLLLVFGFVLGAVIKQVAARLSRGARPMPRIVEDIRAAISVTAAVLLVVLVWDQYLPNSPNLGIAGKDLGLGDIKAPHMAAAIVGFYFGSRS